MKLKIKMLDDSIPVPKYQTAGSVGFDLCASIGEIILPNSTKMIGTAIAVEVPLGFELQIRSRSGLAAKNQVFVLNSPGTVDQDYRGEIKVILHNAGCETFVINKGDRIAQAVLCPVTKVEFELVNELSNTERGTNGFGSTGIETKTKILLGKIYDT